MGLSPWYPLKAFTLFSGIMLAVLMAIGTAHPFERFGPANQATLVRAAIVTLVVALVGEPTSAAAATYVAGASVLAAVLDGVDGWLARRSGMASAFGARFDMEIDALLVLALSLLAWKYDKAGAWIVLAGLMRYLFVGAGMLAPWLQRPLPTSRRRQAACVVQIVGLSVVMLPAIGQPSSAWVSAALLALLSGSFCIDVRWLRQHHE